MWWAAGASRDVGFYVVCALVAQRPHNVRAHADRGGIKHAHYYIYTRTLDTIDTIDII